MWMYEHKIAGVVLLSAALVACSEEPSEAAEGVEATEAPRGGGATAEQGATARPAVPAEPGAGAQAAQPAEAGEAAGPPAEGEVIGALALREGFAADQDAWIGRTVTVRAQFMSATSVGGRVNTLSLIVSQEDLSADPLAHVLACSFGDDAPESVNLTQYAEVTVRGRVRERFGRAALDDCAIVSP